MKGGFSTYKVIDIVGKIHRLQNTSVLNHVRHLYEEEINNDFDLIGTPLDVAMNDHAAMFDKSSKKDHKGNWIDGDKWDKLYCSCSKCDEKVLNILGELLIVCIACGKEIIKGRE